MRVMDLRTVLDSVMDMVTGLQMVPTDSVKVKGLAMYLVMGSRTALEAKVKGFLRLLACPGLVRDLQKARGSVMGSMRVPDSAKVMGAPDLDSVKDLDSWRVRGSDSEMDSVKVNDSETDSSSLTLEACKETDSDWRSDSTRAKDSAKPMEVRDWEKEKGLEKATAAVVKGLVRVTGLVRVMGLVREKGSGLVMAQDSGSVTEREMVRGS